MQCESLKGCLSVAWWSWRGLSITWQNHSKLLKRQRRKLTLVKAITSLNRCQTAKVWLTLGYSQVLWPQTFSLLGKEFKINRVNKPLFSAHSPHAGHCLCYSDVCKERFLPFKSLGFGWSHKRFCIKLQLHDFKYSEDNSKIMIAFNSYTRQTTITMCYNYLSTKPLQDEQTS